MSQGACILLFIGLLFAFIIGITVFAALCAVFDAINFDAVIGFMLG